MYNLYLHLCIETFGKYESTVYVRYYPYYACPPGHGPLKGHNSVRNWCEPPPQLLPREPRGTSSSSSLPTSPFDTADEPQKWAQPSPKGGGGANRRGMTSQSISLAFLLCFSSY